MRNKKYDEDINLLKQIADFAEQKNINEIEFKKCCKENVEIYIKVSNNSEGLYMLNFDVKIVLKMDH